MKVNLGSGSSYIEGWVNVDSNPDVRADVYMEAFDFVRMQGSEIEELYMGHFLEHLMPASAAALLALVADELPEGARVSAVVPDMRAIFAAYDAGEITNFELNDRYVYSYEQPSHHVWCHDASSLAAVFAHAGYRDVQPIDPLTWEPVYWKDGPESRWQIGVRAAVPASSVGSAAPVDVDPGPPKPLPVAVDEVLLNRIRKLRAEVAALRAAGAANGADATDGAVVAEVELVPATPVVIEPVFDPGAGSEASLFDRLPRSVVPLARRLLPDGSRQRRLARFSVESARVGREYIERLRHEWVRAGLRRPGTPTYERWCQGHDAGWARLAQHRRLSDDATNPLMVHVVVTHMGNDADLDRTLRSLVRQSWRHWRALVVGDVSGAAAVRRIADERIEFRAAVPDAIISRANDGLAGVDRDLAMMIESGDLLAPDCVFEIVQVANRDPLVDLVYWDDDLVDHDGHRSDPRFRPSWSPETLLGANYLGSALAIRGRRLALVAGIPDGLHDATTWELVLRCDLDAESVRRIPRVLTHVRRRPQASASASTDVVQRYLDRRQEPATVTLERGTVRTRWEMDAPPHVTVVIPTRHNRSFMGGCLGGLLRTDYPSVDVVVVDNGERTDANEQWYRDSFPQLDLQVEWWTEQPFNYSAVNNAGAALCAARCWCSSTTTPRCPTRDGCGRW